MDVLEIDGASNNSVDNIRDLREQVKYAPMHGTYKIYVIDEVHMLSKSAFNALLKTLEEPPPHVIFIFATTEAGKLPHTILSRVQRFDFKRISEANIRERLEYICSQEAIKPEREALEAIARKADGSMRDALSLFDQVYAFSGADLTLSAARKVLGLPREGLFDGLLAALIRHDQKACFAAIQEAHQEGIESVDFLVAFGEYCRNLLFTRQGVSATALGLSETRYAELSVLAPELRDGDIIRFAKLISDLLAQMRTAANPRLAIELGFARMASLDRVVTLSQILGQDFSTAGTSTQTQQTPVPLPASPTSSLPPPNNVQQPSEPMDLESREMSADLKKKSPVETLTLEAAEPLAPYEEDLDLQMEEAYGRDPDVTSETCAIPEVPRQVEVQLPAEVPLQASASQLPALWPRLLGEFIAAHPQLGSNLLQSRLNCEGEETSELRVAFWDKQAYERIANNSDFEKSLKTFLCSKLPVTPIFGTPFYSEDVPGSGAAKAGVQLLYGANDPMQIPIVNYIFDLFEGRTLT